MVIINNMPNSVKAFVVARFCDNGWWYWGSWDNAFEAHNVATEIGGCLFTQEMIA